MGANQKHPTSRISNILSIAGTDPTGGAGIHADLKSFAAMGAYGMAAVTAVVAQNTQGVRSFVPMDPECVKAQIDAVFDDVRVDAVKIGMIANARIGEAIAERLAHHGARNIVLDPVMVATSGDHLLHADAVDVIRNILVPMSTIITPNLPEAAVLLGKTPDWSPEAMYQAADSLMELGSEWVLLKGGHLHAQPESTDLLIGNGGILPFSAPRLDIKNDHGTGCTLSAALAALLPKHDMPDAVAGAKTYMHGALASSNQLEVGQGRGPLNHFHQLWSRA